MRTKPTRRLKFEDWPAADQAGWRQLFAPGDIFDEGSSAAHLSQASRRDLQCAYARFLGFLQRHNPDVLLLAPDRRLTSNVVAEYVYEIRQTNSYLSVATELHHLRLALRLLCVGSDWSWLHAIQKRIATRAPRKNGANTAITSEQLYELGLQLMVQAEKDAAVSKKTTKNQALMYRDGLLIAILAAIPLRRRTLTALQIGEHLTKSANGWLLHIPAKDAKARRALEFSISSDMSVRIDQYLDHFRKHIPGAARHCGLWASSKGSSMNDGAIYDAVCRRTRAAFGLAINLHRFRHAAGAFWSIEDPVNVRGVRDLLGHTSFKTTEVHYIKSQSRNAARRYSKVLTTRYL
jgi:integrase